jgi:hypothetical protein
MDLISFKQIIKDIAIPILICCLVALAIWDFAADSDYVRKIFVQRHRNMVRISKIVVCILLAFFVAVIIFNVF